MVLPPYQAYLFDLDGTLADTMPSHNQSWLEVFRSEGIVVEKEVFVPIATGMAGVDIIKRFAYPEATFEDIKRLSEKRIPIFKSLISKQLKLLDGCQDFLDRCLAEKKQLALATSSSIGVLDFLIQELELKRWFEVVISRREVSRGKPFPDLFRKAAERLLVSPQQCLVFEDSLAGIQAAEKAEMDLWVLETALTKGQIAQLKKPRIKASAKDFSQW